MSPQTPATATPGPWCVAEETEDGTMIRTAADVLPAAIAVVSPSYYESTCEANARLIAAAPELRDALTRLVCLNATQGVTEAEWEAATHDADALLARLGGPS